MWLLLGLASAASPSSPPQPPAPAEPPAPPAPVEAATGTPIGAPTSEPPPVVDITFASERVLSRVLPVFPEEAVRQGVRVGGCQLRFYVDEAGVPYRVLPVICDEVFVPAATAAGLAWRFKPWLEAGVPRRTRFNMVFIFEYQGRPPEAPK